MVLKYSIYIILFISILHSCSSSKKITEDKKKKPETEITNIKNSIDEIKIDTNIILEPFENEKAFRFVFEKSALLGDVLAKAEKENKWIYLDLSAKWCAPCQIMKRDVYTNEEIAAYFNENFINYLVDVEKGEGPDLKLIYDIKSYPTLLFVDYKGRQMMRKESAVTASGLLIFGQAAVEIKK